MAEQRKAVIKNADMSEAMQQDAVDVASVALSKYNIEKVRKSIARRSSHMDSLLTNFIPLRCSGCCSVYQKGV